jgi:hypothetical protein
MTKFTNSKGEPISSHEGLRVVVKEQFYLLGEIVKDANALRDTYHGSLAGIDKFSKEYNQEYIAAQKQTAATGYRAKNQMLYNNAMTQLEKLQKALVELNSSLDLSDSSLANAVALIKAVGPELATEDKLKINAPFATNQPALKVLQAAYKSAGVVYDGSLDRQIYDPESAVQALGKHAEAALMGDGSVFQFGVAIGKIATLEGVDFPLGNPFPSMAGEAPAVDLEKITKEARVAAGLPPEGK